MTNDMIPQPGDSLRVKPLGSLQIPINYVYSIGEELNSGAFGVVCEAYHKSKPDETIAVKIKPRQYEGDDDVAINEVSMLLYVRDISNVIQLIDFYIDTKENSFYVFQSLAKGGDVFDRLSEKETYSEQDAMELSKNVLETIQSVHNHLVVHRDLKPENLLLKSKHDDTQIWLCDFGDAKVLPGNGEGGLLTFCGTASYSAPEIVNGVEYKQEVDIWSFGCTLYFLLCGFLPFGDGEENPSEIFQRVIECDYGFEDIAWEHTSREAKSLITNLLLVNPKQRFSASQALEHSWFTTTTTTTATTTGGQENNLPSSEFKQECEKLNNASDNIDNNSTDKFLSKNSLNVATMENEDEEHLGTTTTAGPKNSDKDDDEDDDDSSYSSATSWCSSTDDIVDPMIKSNQFERPTFKKIPRRCSAPVIKVSEQMKKKFSTNDTAAAAALEYNNAIRNKNHKSKSSKTKRQWSFSEKQMHWSRNRVLKN